MKNSNRRFNRIATLLGVIAVFGAVGLSSTASAGNGAKVEGVQTPFVDSEGNTVEGVYTMSGDLVGMWYMTDFVLGVATPSGVVTATGTELFVGCYDADGDAACGASDPTGAITFSFRYSGRFDAAGNILHGRCQHPVTGGSGDFAAVSGQMTFHDDPSGCSFYKGQLDW